MILSEIIFIKPCSNDFLLSVMFQLLKYEINDADLKLMYK